MMKSESRNSYFSGLWLAAFIIILITSFVSVLQRWGSTFVPNPEIHLSLKFLPIYALFTLARATIAYFLSLVIALSLGYAAAKNRMAERIILPFLFLGQSIPILGILPGLALGLMHLFPTLNLGLEMACTLTICMSQIWNIALSFYGSIKMIPPSFFEMSSLVGMSKSQNFTKIELPSATIGLAWNSLLSVAGGWFFLTACESFTFGSKRFSVPGLRSYLYLAVEREDRITQIAGIGAMLGIILFVDWVVWWPLLSLSQRFKLDDHFSYSQNLSFSSSQARESTLLSLLSLIRKAGYFFFSGVTFFLKPLVQSGMNGLKISKQKLFPHPKNHPTLNWNSIQVFDFLLMPFLFGSAVVIALSIKNLISLLLPLSLSDFLLITQSSVITLTRVVITLILASIWTIPCAVGIGLSPRLTRFFQPLIQVAASFPSPLLFPFFIQIFLKFKINLMLGAGFLTLISIQWSILFNALAGSMGISKEICQNFKLMGVPYFRKWKDLYLPSIFPFLVTGWASAAGRAWNASIVTEYIVYRKQTLSTPGLGGLIREATIHGKYSILTASLLFMILILGTSNRFVWRKLYRIASKKYRFER